MSTELCLLIVVTCMFVVMSAWSAINVLTYRYNSKSYLRTIDNLLAEGDLLRKIIRDLKEKEQGRD